MGSPKISLKLLNDNKAKKVLFAEAGKEFVDLLFAILTLPIGTTMDGSVRRLYKSVDDMDASHFLPNIDKDELLWPGLPPMDDGFVNGLATYMVTDGLEVTSMSAISGIMLVNRFRVGNGDDDDVDLAEKIVAVGDDEVVALLQAVLRSDTVLSDVFLGRKNETDGDDADALPDHRQRTL